MCYLEDSVLDVTDLNRLVAASFCSGAGQQRLESKEHQNKCICQTIQNDASNEHWGLNGCTHRSDAVISSTLCA